MSTKLPPMNQERMQIYRRLLQKCLSDKDLPVRTQEILQQIDQSLADGEIEYYGSQEDVTIQRGAERALIWHNGLLRDEAGVIYASLSAAEDITERRMMDQRLEESEERFRRVFEEGPLGMVLSDSEFRFLQVNAAFRRMVGYEEAELLRMSLLEIGPGFTEALSATSPTLQKEEQVRFELELRAKDGHRIMVEIDSCSLQLEGRPVLFSLVHDIRDRRAMEEQLLAISLRDELTGLYNRRGLFTLAEPQLKLAARLQWKMALLYMPGSAGTGIRHPPASSPADQQERPGSGTPSALPGSLVRHPADAALPDSHLPAPAPAGQTEEAGLDGGGAQAPVGGACHLQQRSALP